MRRRSHLASAIPTEGYSILQRVTPIFANGNLLWKIPVNSQIKLRERGDDETMTCQAIRSMLTSPRISYEGDTKNAECLSSSRIHKASSACLRVIAPTQVACNGWDG